MHNLQILLDSNNVPFFLAITKYLEIIKYERFRKNICCKDTGYNGICLERRAHFISFCSFNISCKIIFLYFGNAKCDIFNDIN